VGYEAREALAALGNVAVPRLEALLDPKGPGEERAAAASALARIGTRRAVRALVGLARSSDPELRRLGLRKLNRVRLQRGRPVMPRTLAHKMFARELRDYRNSLEPALGLEKREERELKLLGQSYREGAEVALERALRALGCWYDPFPLTGVYEGLCSNERARRARALEYLAQSIPDSLFKPVREIFEDARVEDEPVHPPTAEECVGWVRKAWQNGDAWLRACAIRAARVLPGMDPAEFQPSSPEDPLVEVELAAWAGAGAPAAAAGGGGAR
jgi:hypothetical protein